MKYCVLDNDVLDPEVAPLYISYGAMFERLLRGAGAQGTFEIFNTTLGQYPASFDDFDAVLLTGSRADAFSQDPWVRELRARVEELLQARKKLVGICFGHQIMADALGGDVRKSEKGWGLGRHCYAVKARPDFMRTASLALSVACSHQDQVITPPRDAEVILASDFTPNAGLAYRNGAALSFQPHPEFADDYTLALAELRRGTAPDNLVDRAVASVAMPSNSGDVANYIGQFFKRR